MLANKVRERKHGLGWLLRKTDGWWVMMIEDELRVRYWKCSAASLVELVPQGSRQQKEDGAKLVVTWPLCSLPDLEVRRQERNDVMCWPTKFVRGSTGWDWFCEEVTEQWTSR